MAKAYYDKSHKPLKLSKGSMVYLRLHQGYKIPGVVNHKLHRQRVGPFKVLDKVGALAYRLELTPVMTIHPVVSIAQLEPLRRMKIHIRGRVTLTHHMWLNRRMKLRSCFKRDDLTAKFNI